MIARPTSAAWTPCLDIESTAARLDELAHNAQEESKTVALHLRDAAHHLREMRQALEWLIEYHTSPFLPGEKVRAYGQYPLPATSDERVKFAMRVLANGK